MTRGATSETAVTEALLARAEPLRAPKHPSTPVERAPDRRRRDRAGEDGEQCCADCGGDPGVPARDQRDAERQLGRSQQRSDGRRDPPSADQARQPAAWWPRVSGACRSRRRSRPSRWRSQARPGELNGRDRGSWRSLLGAVDRGAAHPEHDRVQPALNCVTAPGDGRGETAGQTTEDPGNDHHDPCELHDTVQDEVDRQHHRTRCQGCADERPDEE